MPIRDRFVEVLADHGVGSRPRWTVGSGFLVGGRYVLTSAHVVETGAVSVRQIGAKPGMLKTRWPARVRLLGDTALVDLALVELDGDPGAMPPFSYARIDRNTEKMAVIRGVAVVGFPEFKKRGTRADAVRDTAHLEGEIPTSEDLNSGLLSFLVQQQREPRPMPPQDEALGKTPWSGISGAAALVDEWLVGVVSEHQRRAGASTLTLVPITFIDRLPDAALWWAALGVNPAQLRLLPAPVACRIGELPAAAEHYQRRGCDDDLAAALAPGEVVVLSPERAGLGGVGMTQLAGAAARRLWERQDIDLLVWARADERERVVKTYHEATAEIGTGDFLGWLARTERRWLIVFDDLADPARLTDLWPPVTRSGRVLVCTREWSAAHGHADGSRGPARRIEVGPFKIDEAVEYVMTRLGCDVDQAAELARTLRFQPVALAAAASYIQAHGLDCRRYLERFAERHRLLPRMLLGGQEQADIQRSAVTVAWSLGVERHSMSDERTGASRSRYQLTRGPDGTQTATFEFEGSFTQQILNTILSAGGGLGNG